MRAAPPQRRRAVFLDRDGTIIEDAGYIRDPDSVRLLPGAADAIKQLNSEQLLTIVVTNQSGIARGLLSLDEYAMVERRVDDLLTAAGARLDAHYFCPHLPEVTGPCDCRKPGVLLYQQAETRFNVDLQASWWVGDRIRDVLPAQTLGGRGILVQSGADTEEQKRKTTTGFARAKDLAGAVDVILRSLVARRL